MTRPDVETKRQDICRSFSRRKDLMDAVTYGATRAPANAVFERVKAEPRKRLFARFMEALKENRAVTRLAE